MSTINRDGWVGFRYTTTDNRGSDLKYSKVVKITRTRTGTANKGWKRQIANHTNAGTVLSGTYDSVSYSKSGYGEKRVKDVAAPNGVRIYTWSGDYAGQRNCLFSNPTILIESAQNQAMSRFLKQIHKTQVSMSGGVFLGEMREALAMIRKPLASLQSTLSNYLQNVQRLKTKTKRTSGSADAFKRALSGTYLEATFGWLPFVNDLADAMKAYKKLQQQSEEPTYEKLRAIAKEQEYVALSALNNHGVTPVANFYNIETGYAIDEAISVYRGEVCASRVATPAEKARVFGLSPGEFIPTLWELIPWSFLVDYFSNIGDILENSVTDTSSVTWVVRSNIKERKYVYSIRPNPWQPDGAQLISVGGSRSDIITKRRVVSRTPTPGLYVPPLSFELPGSPMKQFSMLALWTQANSIHSQDGRFLGGRRISR
jgi:hypothetical protein